MINRRIIILTVLIVLLLTSSFAAALPTIIDTYNATNYSNGLVVQNQFGSAQQSTLVGQTINITDYTTAGAISFYVERYGSEAVWTNCNSTLKVGIFNATTGTFGTDKKPSSYTPIVSSASFDAIGLPIDLELYTVNITSTLLATGYYTVAIWCDQDAHGTIYDMDTTRYIRVGYDTTSSSHEGNYVVETFGAYDGGANDVIFTLWGDDEAAPTSSPTSPATGDDATNALIDTFTDYLIPLILFLLPAMILGWLTHWEKWPILIGLAIGSGLTYLFLGTDYLWLVILVVIGIGASAYQSTRGG